MYSARQFSREHCEHRMDARTVLLVIGVACTVVRGSPVTSAEAEKIQEKCKEKFGLSNEDLYDATRQMLKGEPVDESKRCFMECVLTEQGLVKDGKLNKEAFIEEILEDADKKGIKDYERKLSAGIERCSKSGGEGKCAVSYNSWSCLLNFMVSLHQKKMNWT
ncbi:general odorant-binding protein 56a-like [Periplaneta americana]|uniref:general odorant-binding protein 56a-like n=1 Tax=Periplaneta americana TaxID=6978 RepID=UPI0037E7B2C9